MKKYVLATMLVLGSLYGTSQELPKEIRFNIELKQFDKAKDALDKYIADPKTQPTQLPFITKPMSIVPWQEIQKNNS
ncbi:MAG: hypothetical protein IPI88_04865 [Chitinophagaceae bacterium]|nr:hypothetical protein [Chitinophagaceae bacterium]